jgi:hypothetical protein
MNKYLLESWLMGGGVEYFGFLSNKSTEELNDELTRQLESASPRGVLWKGRHLSSNPSIWRYKIISLDDFWNKIRCESLDDGLTISKD